MDQRELIVKIKELRDLLRMRYDDKRLIELYRLIGLLEVPPLVQMPCPPDAES